MFGTAPFRTQKHLTLSVFWPLTRWPDPVRERGRYGGVGGGGVGRREEGEERGGEGGGEELVSDAECCSRWPHEQRQQNTPFTRVYLPPVHTPTEHLGHCIPLYPNLRHQPTVTCPNKLEELSFRLPPRLSHGVCYFSPSQRRALKGGTGRVSALCRQASATPMATRQGGLTCMTMPRLSLMLPLAGTHPATPQSYWPL